MIADHADRFAALDDERSDLSAFDDLDARLANRRVERVHETAIFNLMIAGNENPSGR